MSEQQDVRARIVNRLAAKVDDERIDALIDQALGATKDAGYVDITFDCPACKRTQRTRVKGTVPDPSKAVDVLSKLLDQGHGKPAETRKVTATVDVTKRLEEWTDEEIDAELARIGSLG